MTEYKWVGAHKVWTEVSWTSARTRSSLWRCSFCTSNSSFIHLWHTYCMISHILVGCQSIPDSLQATVWVNSCRSNIFRAPQACLDLYYLFHGVMPHNLLISLASNVASLSSSLVWRMCNAILRYSDYLDARPHAFIYIFGSSGLPAVFWNWWSTTLRNGSILTIPNVYDTNVGGRFTPKHRQKENKVERLPALTSLRDKTSKKMKAWIEWGSGDGTLQSKLFL